VKGLSNKASEGNKAGKMKTATAITCGVDAVKEEESHLHMEQDYRSHNKAVFQFESINA